VPVYTIATPGAGAYAHTRLAERIQLRLVLTNEKSDSGKASFLRRPAIALRVLCRFTRT